MRVEVVLSVIIPTHNPKQDYLTRTLEALAAQTLSADRWELVIVDNKSEGIGYRILDVVRGSGVKGLSNVEKANVRIVREEKLGLTHARVRGFQEANGEIVVMVDDDNVLQPDYLERAIKILEKKPQLGAVGGKALPEFEIEPPEWLKGRSSGLGLRNLGDSVIVYPDEKLPLVKGGKGQAGTKIKVTEFPECAPIGAGMVIRRQAALEYVEDLKRRDTVVTDRRGKSLASGGDNDICLTALEHGWELGYFPELELTHLIPKERMTLEYQCRMTRDSMRSFIVMLNQHGIQPWPRITRWTVPLRVLRAWWRDKPWKGIEARFKFQNAIGQFLGRSDMGRN